MNCKSFRINCIRVLKYCKKDLKKNLETGVYFFNDFYEKPEGNEFDEEKNLKKNPKSFLAKNPNFFGKNINIQAIVGKNGSGKSTLMDLVYMTINNFCYMFTKPIERPAAKKLYFVKGLYTVLYFSSDLDEFQLLCKGDEICLKERKDEHWNKLFPFKIGKKTKDFGFNQNKISEITQKFFYTIISNYSLQSFICTNYKRNVYSYEDGEDVGQDDLAWINGIFHKNDGYICPIVLNPYRYEGTIDLKKEMELSKDRLASLLIYYGNKNETPFEPYRFASIKVDIREQFALEKIWNFLKDESEIEDENSVNDNTVKNFITGYSKELNSMLKELALPEKGKAQKELDIDVVRLNDVGKELVVYILIKILTIAKRYNSYLEYKGVAKFIAVDDEGNLQFYIGEDVQKWDGFLKKIRNDKSHITKKIRRAVYLLQNGEFFVGEFDKEKYARHFNSETFRGLSPAEIDERLPPSIFSYELFMNRDGEKSAEMIPYSQLSSGEIQMLQTLVGHAYHIENILSIHTSNKSLPRYMRPEYKNLNLVFDEVEICFHPEYQRQFIKRLLSVLNVIAYEEECCFNVFIITHSPFILSDIPSTNVLFLEEKNEANTDEVLVFYPDVEEKTFVGNIGEMFYSSFFLESTIGAFAEEKLKDLINKKQGGESRMSDFEANQILEGIGDPVIKTLINEIGSEKF